MRVLAGLRLSRDQDESTSIERQREGITAWARSNGHTVIGESEDTDISGGMSLHERPDLREWLSGPKLAQWDILAGHKIERMSRDTEDFLASARILNGKGKWLVSASELVCLKGDGSSSDQYTATILAAAATMGRMRTAELCRESRVKLSQLGRFAGGIPAFGYEPRCLCHGLPKCPNAPKTAGWTLVQGEHAGASHEMAMRATAGDSNGKVARWLNAKGIMTARGSEWKPDVVGNLLRNPALAGYSVRRGKRVRDADGNDVMITAEPILTDDEFLKLQAALDSRKQKRGERVGGHQLLRVAYCAKCSTPDKQVPMYGHLKQGRNGGNIYRCQRCGYATNMARLEQQVESWLLHKIGARMLPHKVTHPAISHTAELGVAERKIAEIDAAYDAGDLPIATYSRQMTKWEAERARLEALPQRAEIVQYEPTETPVWAHWASLDSAGRGAFLRNWGFKVLVQHHGREFPPAVFDISDQSIAEAFGLAA